MSETPDEHGTVDVTDDLAHDEVSQDDVVADLARQAREACVERPELLDLVERVERLEQLDLARRPEELDAVHRTLREALANAGRPAGS